MLVTEFFNSFSLVESEVNHCYFLLLLLNDLEVVVYEGAIREKPSSKEEAWQFIKGLLNILCPIFFVCILPSSGDLLIGISGYSGRQCATVGSVLVTNLKTGFRKGEWDRVEVTFVAILL